ncbi:MAG: helix-turn-helix transcriptional regulator [Lachnospiraceae bacterium]|nr:helix-turn-helix transcriptional regulator [Lachnospiraceae bacterium]
MADISKNIRKLRTEQGLSQEQLAEQIGVTRQTISSWERGASFPDLGMVEKLTSALETDLPHLLDPNAAAGRKGRRVKPLGYRFIGIAVILYIASFLLLSIIFPNAFGSGTGIVWAVLLLVAFIAFCTCLIMEHVSDCTAPPDSTETSSSKDEE